MDITLTQAMLFYYGQIKFDIAQRREFETSFISLLIDGMSTANRGLYPQFCSRFNKLIAASKFRMNLKILDEDFDKDTFHDLGRIDPYDSYKMPAAYYLNPVSFIEEHRNSNPTPEFTKIVYTIAQDETRRVFETSLAWSVLANIPEHLFGNLSGWNAKLFKFLTICSNQLTSDAVFRAQRFLDIYERLLAIDLNDQALKFPKQNEIFKGRMLWDTHSVAHEVYEILKICCQPVIQIHDDRLTVRRREIMRDVALSWLLIRTVLDLFNDTLHLKNVLDHFIDIPNFRGRVMVPDLFRGDRPISPPSRGFEPPTPWPVRELGIIRGRTTLPQYPVTRVTADDKSAPTYFTIPNVLSQNQADKASEYTFSKALENCFVDSTSCWATFCREQKVHPAIGGGSGSFFYISRVLLSTQDRVLYRDLFPGLHAETYTTLDIQPNFTIEEFSEFVKILGCLWVGVTGGHCFLEILFTLNMDPVVEKYKEIFGFDSSCNLTTALGSNFWRENLRQILNQVSDYNTSRIFNKYQSTLT